MFRNELHWRCEAQHRNNSQRRGFVEHGNGKAERCSDLSGPAMGVHGTAENSDGIVTQRNAERRNSKVLNCNGIAKG